MAVLQARRCSRVPCRPGPPTDGNQAEAGCWRQVPPSFHMREPSTSQSSIIDSWLPRTVAVTLTPTC